MAAGRTKGSLALLVSVAVAIATVLSLAIIGTALGLSIASRSSSEDALHTLVPSNATANQLLADVVDQETGERGYVITGQTRFLQPYNAGRGRVRGLVAQLRGDLVGRPADLRLLSQFVYRYERWLTVFAMPQIADVRSGHGTAAVAREKTGLGKEAFDRLRASMSRLLHRIAVGERRALSKAKGLQSWLIWVALASVVLLIAGNVALFLLLRRWVINPIRSLDEEVRLVATRDVDHAIEAAGPEELTRLGRNVELMRREVRSAFDETKLLRTATSAIQEAFAPTLPDESSRFSVAFRYVPGSRGVHLGGDWINIHGTAGGGCGFAVGDVAGHGLVAVAEMARLRFAIEAFLQEDPQPDRLLHRLARISPEEDSGRFSTVLAGLCESDSVTLSSAGHLPPLLILHGEADYVPLTSSLPISLGFDAYTATSYNVPRGATLLAFTDGLVEQRSDSITAGLERLRKAASAGLADGPLLDHVLAEMIPGGAADDVAIVAIRWL